MLLPPCARSVSTVSWTFWSWGRGGGTTRVMSSAPGSAHCLPATAPQPLP